MNLEQKDVGILLSVVGFFLAGPLLFMWRDFKNWCLIVEWLFD